MRSRNSSTVNPKVRSTTRRGFTLVELLVATTVTLLLILALAQAFAIVSETVSMNRAMLELAGQTRGVTMRLQKDLTGLTAPDRPWLQAAMGLGYFEIYDGPSSDVDADANGVPDASDPIADTSMGDVDDVWMGTVRNENEPFTGILVVNSVNTAIQSTLAEVVWWTALADTNQNGVIDEGETRYNLFRRALLIRPDLNNASGYVTTLPPQVQGGPTSYDVTSQSDLALMAQHMYAFYNDNDLSVRFRRVESGSSVVLQVIANSLSDLTIRRNRFCHDPVVYRLTPAGNLAYLPDATDHFPHPLNVHQSVRINAAGAGTAYFAELALNRVMHAGTRLGEDVMLTNVLAFDLQVYDPYVLLSAHPGMDGSWGVDQVNDDGTGGTDDVLEAGWPGSDDEILLPDDYGYGTSGTIGIGGSPPLPAAKAILPVGSGGFVDLSYFAKSLIVGYPSSYSTPYFSSAAATRSRLYGFSNPAKAALLSPNAPVYDSGTYDTWPFDYENDGFDQDGDGVVDEGTNGIDDDGVNGVDDPVELETSPPYPYALRGVRIRIRVIDPDTRQVRQTSVTVSRNPD